MKKVIFSKKELIESNRIFWIALLGLILAITVYLIFQVKQGLEPNFALRLVAIGIGAAIPIIFDRIYVEPELGFPLEKEFFPEESFEEIIVPPEKEILPQALIQVKNERFFKSRDAYAGLEVYLSGSKEFAILKKISDG